MNDEDSKSNSGRESNFPQSNPSSPLPSSSPLEKGLNEGKLPDFQFTPPPPPDPPKTDD